MLLLLALILLLAVIVSTVVCGIIILTWPVQLLWLNCRSKTLGASPSSANPHRGAPHMLLPLLLLLLLLLLSSLLLGWGDFKRLNLFEKLIIHFDAAF